MDLKLATKTVSSGLQLRWPSEKLLKVHKQIPAGMEGQSILRAINKFYDDIGVRDSREGFLSQTVERIACATYLNRGDWEFWCTYEEGEITSYLLASIDKAIDNNFAYFIHQAWIDKKYRANGFSKECWARIKERAKNMMCKHLIIYSVRNNEAYQRFLGGGLEHYSTLLRMNLGG